MRSEDLYLREMKLFCFAKEVVPRNASRIFEETLVYLLHACLDFTLSCVPGLLLHLEIISIVKVRI